jgi:uncharacterized protein
MSNNLQDLPVTAFLRGLSALTHLLETAEKHVAEHKISPPALLDARLFPDMFTFTGQVRSTCDTAKRGSARLVGVEPPPFDDDETSFEQLRGRVEKTSAFIVALPADAFRGADQRTVEMKMPGREISLTGFEYLTRFALPNFYFHLTTAYNILRHNGVVVGKSDFLGDLTS